MCGAARSFLFGKRMRTNCSLKDGEHFARKKYYPLIVIVMRSMIPNWVEIFFKKGS